MADIKSVGIVGAGQMGAGIAQVCAAAGYQVRLYDVSPDRVEAGIANIAAARGGGSFRGERGREEEANQV